MKTSVICCAHFLEDFTSIAQDQSLREYPLKIAVHHEGGYQWRIYKLTIRYHRFSNEP